MSNLRIGEPLARREDYRFTAVDGTESGPLPTGMRMDYAMPRLNALTVWRAANKV